MPRPLNDYLTLLTIKNRGPRRELIEELKKDFPLIIKSSHDLYNLFLALRPRERNELGNDFQAQLLSIISSLRILYSFSFSSLLNEELKETIFHHLMDQGKILRATSKDAYLIQLKSAPEAYRNTLIEQIKKDFSRLIKSTEDLEDFLMVLQGDERDEFCDDIVDRLPAFISSFKQLTALSFLFSDKAKEKLFFLLKNQDKIPEPASLDDYRAQLKSAPEAYCKILIGRIKKDFSQLIKTPAHLYNLLISLAPEERQELCDEFEEQLPNILSDFEDFTQVSSLLPEKLKANLFDLLSNKEPSETNAPSGILAGSEKIDQMGISLPPSIGTPLFFQPARAKKIRPILDNPESNLSLEQLTRIQEQIDQLNSEINSCWPYPNIWRKELKVMALEALIEYASTQSVSDAVQQIKLDFPNVTKGHFSTRTADLLADLERETSLVSSI